MASVPELLNLEKFKSEVHRILISKLDLEKLSRVESAQARQVVANSRHLASELLDRGFSIHQADSITMHQVWSPPRAGESVWHLTAAAKPRAWFRARCLPEISPSKTCRCANARS